MSVSLQTNTNYLGFTCPASIALTHPVQLGNIIVIFLGGSSDNYPNPPRTPRNVTFTDNLGNTYHRGVTTDDSDRFVAGWYAYVTNPGLLTASATSSGPGPIGASCIISEIVGEGRKYIDGQCQIGRYVSSLPEGPAPLGGIKNPRGYDTGPMPISGDTVIMTGHHRPRILQYQIDSGDSLVTFDTGGDQPWLGLFENSVSGAGASAIQTKIQTNVWQGPVDGNIGSMYFSKPLARPGGTTAQYGVTPGRGFGDGSLPVPSTGWDQDGVFQSQRTVRVPLPYYPVMGSLVIFALAQNVLTEAAGYVFTVSDTYGNVWHPITGAIEAGHGATVKGFYTYLTALPPSGENFIAQFTVTGPFTAAVVYQTPGAFLVEHTNINSGVAPVGTGTLSKVGGPPSTITTNSLVCAGNSILTAIAYMGGTTAWTPLESYTIRSQWDVEQIPDPDTVNNGKMITLALEDKSVAAGTYDAQIISDANGPYGMILIAAPISDLVLACPVDGSTAQVGVAYSKLLQASGGVAPYTWAITSGALPPGLSLNTVTGEISGTPTVSGMYDYTATATDSVGTHQPVSCSITVTNPKGIRRGMSILTAKQFATIREKHLRSHQPTDIYLDHEFPNAGFHVWPVPIGTPEIEFYYWAVLQQFAALDSQISFPPGYYDALVFNLALMLTSAYNRPANPELRALADNGKRLIQEMNAQIIAGSYHQARTLLGPNIGDLQPAATAPDPKNPPMPGSSPVIVKP